MEMILMCTLPFAYVVVKDRNGKVVQDENGIDRVKAVGFQVFRGGVVPFDNSSDRGLSKAREIDNQLREEGNRY